MGVYCNRVAAKGRKLADGNVVHEMSFAYKYGRFEDNDRWHKRYAAPAERAWDKKPEAERHNVLVVDALENGAPVYRLPYCRGTLTDGKLGLPEEKPFYGYPVVGKLRAHGKGYRLVSNEELKAEAAVRESQRAELDALWRANTGFRDLEDCLNAGGRYRPSMDMRQPVMQRLADDYDAAQAARGDDRRAYRYGVN